LARAGIGGHARADDVGVGDQHHRAVFDEEEILKHGFYGFEND
jgi:hypothetical protein